MNRRKDRVNKILTIVREVSSITIKDLALKLNVSKMTIRRDLERILSDPEIQFIRGVLIYSPAPSTGNELKYSVISASTLNRNEKERIAAKAASLLEPDDTIIIDAGSTTELLACTIPEDIKLEVICFSLNILNQILKNRNCSITLPGGKFHSSSMVFQSREGIKLLENTRVKKAFISAYGVNLKLGVTCSAYFEREMKMTAINAAEQRILLADSSKFKKVKNIHFADLEDFDIIITDNKLPRDIAEKIEKRGITLFTV